MRIGKKKLEELAKETYPDVMEELYPTKKQFIVEKTRLIDLRSGFIKGYLARH